MSIIEKKNKSNENEKKKEEESMISLFYSFKKNITSQDPFYPLNNLLLKNNIYGWQSSRFCTYPQEIVVEFHSYVNIKLINLLIHEKKIPTLIEIVNCIPKNIENDSNMERSNIYYINKNLGSIKLSPNTETNYKARELRKIHVNIFTKRLKFIIHKNYSNNFNIFCQVGIISMNFYGYIVEQENNNNKKDKLNYSELNLEEDIDDLDDNIILEKMDDDTKEKLKQLMMELNEKKEMEEYEECIMIKNKIDQLKKISFKIYNLENYKNQFSAMNDFDNSQKIKNEIEILRKRINSNSDENNNYNNKKFNTINTELLIHNNYNFYGKRDEEESFMRKMKDNNNKINNSLKLSQSQHEIFNISENKYDDIVLPTIQKKINTNLNSININNNSSNSFDNNNNNSNNSFGAIDSFKDKNEKFNLKDIPPPEDISEEMQKKI